jgi:glycerol kinase
MLETTALGAAIAAGFASGVWETFDELKNVNIAGTTQFTPKIEKAERDKKFAKWEKAVEMCRGWVDE